MLCCVEGAAILVVVSDGSLSPQRVELVADAAAAGAGRHRAVPLPVRVVPSVRAAPRRQRARPSRRVAAVPLLYPTYLMF